MAHNLPQRWVPGGPTNNVSVRVVRYSLADGSSGHVLERRGGTCPPDWICLIDPGSFEPFFVPPEQKNLLSSAYPALAMSARKSISAETKQVSSNWFQREKYTTYARIQDLSKLPRFVIDTPTFKFDSHAHNPGWMLTCKQRHHNSNPGKLVIKLMHEKNGVTSTVHIRPSKHCLHKVVETEADFLEVFQNDFAVETNVVAQLVHRPISAYSDDELLSELQKRTSSRLNGWSPRKKTADINNVIDLDDLRLKVAGFDAELVSKILSA